MVLRRPRPTQGCSAKEEEEEEEEEEIGRYGLCWLLLLYSYVTVIYKELPIIYMKVTWPADYLHTFLLLIFVSC
jgi:hypothetical protein